MSSPRAPAEIDENFLRSIALPMPSGDTDKEARGRVVIVGGSRFSPGAVMLSGYGALRAGAGKVQLAVPSSLSTSIGVAFLEAGVIGFSETASGNPSAGAARDLREAIGNASSVLIGPGLMDETSAGMLACSLLGSASGPAFVIDALALTGLRDNLDHVTPHPGPIIFTPHAGEMAQLVGASREQVQSQPERIALEIASRHRCFVVLKGATTYIGTPNGELFRHRGGVEGLATAGSGDVLAGVIAALAARGASPLQACAWGVFAHARAGEKLSKKLGPLGLIAREIPGEIPAILAG